MKEFSNTVEPDLSPLCKKNSGCTLEEGWGMLVTGVIQL